MLNIILMILKVIGIIIAALIGILLILVIEILWVPFRYRVIASKYEEIKVRVNFSWLLRLIYVLIQYEDSKLFYRIRVFGIPIIDSRRPKKEKKKKQSKVKKKRKANKKVKTKASPQEKEMLETRLSENEDTSNTVTSSSNEPILNNEDSAKEVEEVLTVNDEEQSEHDESKKPKENHRSMKYRIRKIIDTIKALPHKIGALVQKIVHALNYPKKFKVFLSDEKNKSAIGLIFQSVKNVLKHASPRHVKGEIVFGLEDPCSTGQALGGISVAAAYLNLRKLRIIPDFEEAKLEGYIRATGRVYSFTVLRIVIRLLNDTNFKTLKESFKQLKEG